MKNNERRRAKPEAQTHLGETAQLIARRGPPWSEEEKAELLQQHKHPGDLVIHPGLVIS